MSPKEISRPKALLPKGTEWATREKVCLKCDKIFTSDGYIYTVSGRWIGSRLCWSCNAANSHIREPQIAGRFVEMGSCDY